MSEEAASILVEARRAIGPMHPGMEGAGTVSDTYLYLSVSISLLYVGSLALDSTDFRFLPLSALT
jgi:hypothetical protein